MDTPGQDLWLDPGKSCYRFVTVICFEAESQEAQAGLVAKVVLLFLIFLPLHSCVGKHKPPYSVYLGAGNGAQGCCRRGSAGPTAPHLQTLYPLLFKNPKNLESEVMVSKRKCIVWQPSFLTYLGIFSVKTAEKRVGYCFFSAITHSLGHF